MRRKPYDQGWLDGQDAAVRELRVGAEQDTRLADLLAELARLIHPRMHPDHPPVEGGYRGA